jgi:hypothetical protein
MEAGSLISITGKRFIEYWFHLVVHEFLELSVSGKSLTLDVFSASLFLGISSAILVE